MTRYKSSFTLLLMANLFRWAKISIYFVLILNLSLIFFNIPKITQATDTSYTNFVNNNYYNQLISDGAFIDINSMSVADIDAFLRNAGGRLNEVSENGRSASQIIYDAAHGYPGSSGTINGIAINSSTGTVSPKVLIVMLQKEQSLITTYNPDRWWKAMGYACYSGVAKDYNGNGCADATEGFTNQIDNAAWKLRYNYEACVTGLVSPYTLNNILSLDTFTVQLTNRATASLYRYTPHVYPGNYNFWRLSAEWFGLTSPPPGAPSGYNDTVGGSSGTYQSSVTAKGVKTTDVRAYFGDRLIADYGSTTWQVSFTPEIGNVNYIIYYKNSGGEVVATKTITIERRKPGDINGDGTINIQDLSLLSNEWNRTVDQTSWVNLNPEVDSTIDILDLSIVASNWGK